MANLLPIVLIFTTFITSGLTLSISIKPIDNSDFHRKRDMLMLVKRKFLPFYDPFMTDEIEADFLRTADQFCVLKKLNLNDDPKITLEDLKMFDVRKPFGELAQDINLIVVVIMQLCMDDIDEYSKYTFEKGIECPIVEVYHNATECAVNELFRFKKQKPLFLGKFEGLKFHTQIECDKILEKFTKFIDDFNSRHYRGCMKDNMDRFAEYLLKFRIMHNEKTSESIKKLVRNDYMRHNNDKESDEKVANCLIEKYAL